MSPEDEAYRARLHKLWSERRADSREIRRCMELDAIARREAQEQAEAKQHQLEKEG